MVCWKANITNKNDIASASYYSVSLFILLMGVTTYWSYCKTGDKTKKILKRIFDLFIPYTISVIILFCSTYRFFDAKKIIEGVLHFNSLPLHYYVLLYIQLLLISPVTYHLLQDKSIYMHY